MAKTHKLQSLPPIQPGLYPATFAPKNWARADGIQNSQKNQVVVHVRYLSCSELSLEYPEWEALNLECDASYFRYAKPINQPVFLLNFCKAAEVTV